MDTLKKIIYDIRDIARQGGIVDDERISYRQIKEWVNQYRALLIRRDLDKNKTISDNIVQDLGCLEMMETDCADCCNITSDCSILRSVLQIPKTIELSSKDALIYVGHIAKNKGYEMSSAVQSGWDRYNKYTSKVPKYFLDDGYIYVTNESFLRYINVSGIFADPTAVANFNTCDGESCYTDDDSYPISNHMLPTIKDLIFKQELRLALTTTPDTTNDGIGNAEPKRMQE